MDDAKVKRMYVETIINLLKLQDYICGKALASRNEQAIMDARVASQAVDVIGHIFANELKISKEEGKMLALEIDKNIKFNDEDSDKRNLN